MTTTFARTAMGALFCLALMVSGCKTQSTITTNERSDSSQGQAEGADSTAVPPTVPPTVEPPTPIPPTAVPTDVPEVDSEQPPQSEPESEPADDGLETSVVLLDAGAEPRQELRYVYQASCNGSTTYEATQEFIQELDGETQPGPGPITTITEMQSSVSRQGDLYEVTREIVAARTGDDAPADLAPLMDDQLATIVGLRMILTVNDRGVVVLDGSMVEGAEGLDAPPGEGLTTLQQAQPALPIEAIGVGAKWQVDSQLTTSGVVLNNTAVFELVSADDLVVEIHGSASQVAAPGSTMQQPGGITMEVDNWVITTTSQAVIDLAALEPVRLTSTSTGEQSFNAQGLTLDQTIRTEVTATGLAVGQCAGATQSP